MAIYYIDPSNGNNINDGLSENTPVNNETSINIMPGDTVLFKRGSFRRGKLNNISGEEGRPITYGSYGKGNAPIFCGSVDLGKADLWYEAEENIWYTEAIQGDEAGNFVFNNSEIYGTLRWTKAELCEQGDFYDECFGYRESKKEIPINHKIYLYSEKNPAEFYENIECVPYGPRNLGNNGHDMIIKDLNFVNSGVHGISGEGHSWNITMHNCYFKNIGGCVWNYDLKIRYGNAFETWDIAENIEVSHCTFENIYDSAVTHQGGTKSCKPAKNIKFNYNTFIKCGMAAYEQRDRMPEYAEFIGNVCIDAGMGFSLQGETLPRRSEIWPQPMGHHIFLWRIENPTPNGEMIIKDNSFCNAPIGAAIYSIISGEAEKQLEISNNSYYTENPELINRINGIDYATFDKYKQCEKNASYMSKEEAESKMGGL